MSTVLLPLTGKRKPADLFAVGCFEKEKPLKALSSLEADFSKQLASAAGRGRFSGKSGHVFSSYDSAYREAPEIVVIGLGRKGDFKPAVLQKAFGRLIRRAKAAKSKRVRVLLDSFAGGEVSLAEAAGILSEETLLAAYDFNRYRSKSGSNGKPGSGITAEALVLKKAQVGSLKKQLEWHRAVAEGTLRARDLVNEPGNVMTAPRLAQEARKMAAKKKLSCRVLGLAEIRRLKMGGILAVNQGSTTPPALITLEYGRRHARRGTVCLVGKGVTFDTGGISIKPSRDMEKMKYDMAGAAAVIATLGVVADLKLPLHVIGITPAVENNVAANPQRPGDIIRMYSGKTVEVLNTDAEGRLILADALAYAEKFRPKAIIDLATLTGMCAYTFGDKAIGLMGTDEKLIGRLKKAGEMTGERCWELPLWDEYRKQIQGHHSDLYNIGGTYGGTITAGMFLKEFVPKKTPWAHLDIAGTAWCNAPRYDCPKGATGVGVRLVTRLLSDWK